MPVARERRPSHSKHTLSRMIRAAPPLLPSTQLARHAEKWEANVPASKKTETDVDFKTWLQRRVEKALTFATKQKAGSPKHVPARAALA